MMVEVISGVEGGCLAFDDYRVAGNKPWGGGQVLHSFKVEGKYLKNVSAIRSLLATEREELVKSLERAGYIVGVREGDAFKESSWGEAVRAGLDKLKTL